MTGQLMISGRKAGRDLGKALNVEVARVLIAQQAALDTWGKLIRDDIRRDITAGVRGRGRKPKRLANTVRALVYPSRGLAYQPAAAITIAEGAVRIIDAGDRGAIITPLRRRMLTIPVPGSPAEISNGRVMTDPRGPITRAQFIARQLGAKLVFVPPSAGRPGLLVARGGTGVFVSSRFIRRGKDASDARFRDRAGRLKKGVTAISQDVPLFFVVPFARVQKRFSTRAIAGAAAAAAPARVARLFQTAHAALSGLDQSRARQIGIAVR